MKTINSRLFLTGIIAVAALGCGTAAPAFAAEDLILANRTTECATNKDANTILVKGLQAAKDENAMRALLAAPIKENPLNALCIMDVVKVQAPAISRQVFQIIVSLLGNSEENEPIIRKLAEENPDIVAQIAADVEPAAGPGDTGNTQESPFSGGANPENPNQLNEGDATTPPASPSLPL